jgi:hypothetical protein
MTLDRLDTIIAFAVVMLGVSLLITIATQIISSFLGLRGSNLLWGIKTILQDSGITTELDKIAREVLTDPEISDSVFSKFEGSKVIGYLTRRWRLATAIRPDELSRILMRIAEDPANFGGPDTATAIDNALSAVDRVAHNKLQRLQAELVPAGSHWTVAADKVVQQVTDSARQSVLRLETSFATAMDRVSQRFAMNTRFCAVTFAFALAFGVHLDSLHLLQQLATNPEQRNALVNMRDEMLKQAGASIPAALPAAPAEPAYAPAILKEAMDNLKNTATDSHLPETPNFASYTEGVNWLRSNNQGALEARYQQAIVSALQQHATDINNHLIQSGFQLIPSPYSLWPLFNGKQNLLGILITAAFLSLGAPFWFNALKSLSNLRTVLADNESKETGKA